MILNRHLKIEPIVHESFVTTEKGLYDEIGIVVDKDPSIQDISIGSKVYFDSWLAHKISKEGDDKKFYWYVKYDELFDAIEPLPTIKM